MNREQKTIKKIQEAVPEIKELKFGCKVKTEFGILLYQSEFAGSTCGGKMMSRIIEYYCFDEIEQKVQVLHKKDFKIIGKDITLEDVLVAIEKESGLKIKTIFGSGGYMKDDLISIIENWEPNKPLQDQRDETKELIGNLLDI